MEKRIAIVTSVIPNGRFFVTKIFSYAVQEIGFYEDNVYNVVKF